MTRLAAVVLCVAFVGFAAADETKAGDPTGTWTWTVQRGGQPREQTLTLKLDGDKLTGTMPGRNNTETKIEDGKFRDGEVTFKVTWEFTGQKFTTTYTAKVAGDTLKGTIETKWEDGETATRAFAAKRVQDK
jgi:hypothetical protein